MNVMDPLLWAALLKIIGLNTILSGDNAVVIALAARALPARQQKQAMFWGSAAAIVMLVLLTLFAVQLLTLSWLKLVGSALLVWIGVQLFAEEEDDVNKVAAHTSMFAAIKTILIADLVMSLDNVIAVAAAAHGRWGLVVVGLAVSVPMIIFASALLIKVMERFPVVITIGAGLIGWVAGDMAWEEKALESFTARFPEEAGYLAAALGSALVIGLGKFFARRQAVRTA